MDKSAGIILVFVLPGIFLILFQLWLLSGKRKDFYMATHIFSGRVYAGIPLGTMFLLWAVVTMIPLPQWLAWVIFYTGVGFGLLGGIFYVFQPSFLKPAWLKWLESEHREIMPLLQHEANEMGLKAWEEQVKTQANLEAWVLEVRRKHRL